jgi:NAD(P)-dependent dehydrogenase (short-subunit alcohol dehydrogenase family)
MAGSVAYAATKAALDAFTITFADEVGKYGITVNAVDPGPTDTGWMTQEKQRELLSRHPSDDWVNRKMRRDWSLFWSARRRTGLPARAFDPEVSSGSNLAAALAGTFK